MADRRKDDEGDGQRRIYVGDKGQRFVKAEELLRDPNVRRRLERADHLASKLGLKGKRDA